MRGPDISDFVFSGAARYRLPAQKILVSDTCHAVTISNATSHEDPLPRAIALHRQGRLDEAERIYRELLAVDPNSPDALHFLGVLKHQLGQSALAIEYIGRAVELEPGHAGMRSNLGNVYKESGRLGAAESCYLAAIELAPDFADAHCNLAVVLRARERPAEAVAALRTAIAIDPNHCEAHLNLGEIDRDQRDWSSAIDHFRAAIRGRCGSGLRDRGAQSLVAALCRAGRADEATAELRAWRDAAPDNPIAAHLLAAMTGTGVPPRASDDYIKSTFDSFAASFDRVLEKLHYHAPKFVALRFEDFARGLECKPVVLDAACGTGLVGELIRPCAQTLVGLDLSPQMLRRAAERDVYDSLLEAELAGYLQTTDSRFDAITCADSLIYFGELEEVLCAARRVLNPGGFLCFTVEKIPPDTRLRDFELQAHGRYRHRASYVRRALEQAGFIAIQIEDMHARAEAGEPVASLLVTARVSAPAQESSRGSVG